MPAQHRIIKQADDSGETRLIRYVCLSCKFWGHWASGHDAGVEMLGHIGGESWCEA